MRFVVAALLLSCSGPANTATSFVATLAPLDVAAGTETFECFGFDAKTVAGEYVTGIHFDAPPSGGLQLHHAALYAYPTDYPDGPVPCNEMPLEWQLHVWFQGGDDVTLPTDVGLKLRPDTKRLVVHAHVLRTTDGPPATAKVTLALRSDAPAHVATVLGAAGAVPAIRPHMQETTTTRCKVGKAMHVLTTAPHMHRLGTSFHGGLEPKSGAASVMVDVPMWSFDRQATYPVNLDLVPGDVVVSTCTWFNPTNDYVLPGYKTSDEMCGQALVVYPTDAAWDGDCY